MGILETKTATGCRAVDAWCDNRHGSPVMTSLTRITLDPEVDESRGEVRILPIGSTKG
jgi:hypothetical protein